MEAQAGKPTNPILIIASIAVILFCAVGIGAIMGWIPTSTGSVAAPQTADASREAFAQPPAPTKDPASTPKTVPVPKQAASKAACTGCGVVESVRAIDAEGSGSGLGGVGGAIVGGLLGNEVGAGRGRDAMTVIGAVGGAVAGNAIEKRMKSTKIYRITVRFDDGSSREFSESSPPAWRAGDRVRVVDGQIRPNNA